MRHLRLESQLSEKVQRFHGLSGIVRCPDYSRDLSIKDSDIDEAVKNDQA